MKEKLQEYALIAEIVGGVAIVLSLIYVALQIQQNTNALKSSAIQEISRWSYDATVLYIENPELREATLASCNKALTEDQFFLLRSYYGALLRIQANRYYQAQLGVLSEEASLALGGRGSVWRRPIFIEMWGLEKGNFEEDFQMYVENQLVPLAQNSC